MKDLNICIDIDGTITDPYYWLDIANKYFNKNIKPWKITEYSINETIGVSIEEYLRFYEKNRFKIHNEEPIREDAVKIINKLFNRSNIYFVTARDKDLEMLTYHYLNKHNVPYDDVFVLGTTHKSSTAKDVGCDVFIEDSYENALELSKDGFKVLLIDTTYNRKPLNENIMRVFSWDEIYEIVEKMLLHRKVV
jgi:uncharacterized protein